jgi:hypothetical protein
MMIPEERPTLADALRVFFAPEIRSWRGALPLRTVFWGYGVLASLGIAAVYILSMDGGYLRLQQVLLPCIAAYTLYALVSIWRSSRNTDNPLWGLLARHLVVVWAGNTIMVLIFLQLDLIEKYFEI